MVFWVQHDFHADLVTGLYTAAEAVDYEVALSAVTPRRNEHTAISGLLQDRCEALILLGPQSTTNRLAQIAARLPVVAVARPVRAAAVDVVRTADVTGAQQAVDHLVALGHRSIAHIDGGQAPGAAERRRGYRHALAAHGLAAGERILRGGLGEDDGARAAQQLLAAPPLPTAVTVFNDRCALGVLDVLRSAGLSVPDDISVVGYDDSRLAGLSTVALTTVGQDVETLTALAVRRAIERLHTDARDQREQVVAPHLVLRSTTGPPAR